MPSGEKETTRCFIDTNIWLYAFIDSGDARKRGLATEVISQNNVVISTQVINETCANLLKKASFPEASIRQLVAAFYEKYAVMDIERETLLVASDLRQKNKLSFWDSVIVASALRSDCDVLYSEDTQDSLGVESKLTVIDPFKAKQEKT